MTDVTEIKGLIEAQGKTFEEFKKTNDEVQAQLKKLGSADVVLEEKLKKLDEHMTKLDEKKSEIEKRADELEKKLNRPGRGGGDSDAEAKALDAFNRSVKAAAVAAGRQSPADLTQEQYAEYRAAQVKYFRRGRDEMDQAEVKAMQVGVDSDGGYLVTADTTGRIVSKVFDLSPIRQIAAVQPIGTDALEGIADTGEAGAGWVSETGTRSATTSPTIGKWRIPVEEMYAMPEATQKLLDDANVDVEMWLADKVAERLARLEGAAFVAGTGVGQPRGFTTYTTAATSDATRTWGTLEHCATANNGDFASSNGGDVLFDVVGAMKDAYLAGARWVTRREVITKVRKLKESSNAQYLWQPGLQAGQPQTLLGFPITIAQDMPSLTTGSLSMAFGNFSIGYQIVDRQGIRVLRDPFTNKPYVRFYTTRRVGGDVVHFEAIKFVKFGS